MHSPGKIFDPKRVERLNSPDRLNLFKLEQIIAEENLEFVKNIGDLGIGSGALTDILLRYLPNANCWGIDISKEMLDYVEKNRGNYEGRLHLKFMEETTKIPLEDKKLDLLTFITVYHEVDDQLAVLKEIRRVLRPDGKLLLMDWKKESEDREYGPPADHLYSQKEIMEKLDQAGFKNIKVLETDRNILGILADN